MGDIADAMIEGELCQECGCYIGKPCGFPRYCLSCKPLPKCVISSIPDVIQEPFVIRLAERDFQGNWSYTIYLVNGKKWKNIRAMEGYKDSSTALTKAQNYLAEFSHRHLSK